MVEQLADADQLGRSERQEDTTHSAQRGGVRLSAVLCPVHCAARCLVFQIPRFDLSFRFGEGLDFQLQIRHRGWARVHLGSYAPAEGPNDIVEIAFNRFADVAGHRVKSILPRQCPGDHGSIRLGNKYTT